MTRKGGEVLTSLHVGASTARRWLFGAALPFWIAEGIDLADGGFVEHLAVDGGPGGATFKRTRVTARQVYVFSHAALLGVPGAREAAEHGVSFLMEKHSGDRSGLWHRCVDPCGRVIDATPDLYDLAFVLFALAWWNRLSGDARVPALAHETLLHAAAALPHPSGRGYVHEAGGGVPFQQNPHMHLLEALVELFLTTGDDRFLAEARRIRGLFRDRFLVDFTLREFFDARWEPASGAEGRLVEPGHMAEWAWLLRRYDQASGDDDTDVIVPMMEFVIKASLMREDGLLVDAVFEDGRVMKPGTRLWPQTEMLKGLVAYAEVTGRDVSTPLERARRGLFERFLDPAPTGCWIDHLDAAGQSIVDKIPASSLYHLMLGLSEYLNFADGVPRTLGEVS
jgi:mannose/cellobiose epimerase-like protein (N-acyl-D-glucosamine 2-epimerase family)